MDDQRTALSGDLETLSLASVLKMLSLGDRTGYLRVTSGPEEIMVTLLHGQLAAVDEPNQPPLDLMLALRLLERIEESQAMQVRQMAGNNHAAMMTLMMQNQLMTPQEVQRRVEHSVITPLSRSMRWTSGQFTFRPDPAPMFAVIPQVQPMVVDYAILEANRLADEQSQQDHTIRLPRQAVPRWRPETPSLVEGLALSTDDMQVLRLANGQLNIRAIAHALILAESQVAEIVVRLLDMNMVELVDLELEMALAQHLAAIMDETRGELARHVRLPVDERLKLLVRVLTLASNRLLTHHAFYARDLRGRGEVRRIEITRHLDATFEPILASIRKQFPRMDSIVRIESGAIDATDLETLHKVVRGSELMECYCDAAIMQSQLLQVIFERVLDDELGHSSAAEQLDGGWNDFTRELDYEIARLLGRDSRINA
ncbi:MAG TPA: DUF4388 domain-containing protein [Ktedonobacterales bacterium]